MSDLCPTLRCLLELGFELRPPEYGTDIVGYRFKFLDLKAFQGVNRYFRDVVFLTGVLNTGRTIGEIDSEIPQDLCDKRTVAAWVAMGLGSDRRDLSPYPRWLELGAQDAQLINLNHGSPSPPELKTVARCTIDLDHARTLRQRLRETVAAGGGDPMDASFTFDGRVFGVTVATRSHEALASGEPWPRDYRVVLSPGTIPMPARFTGHRVAVVVYETFLRVGSLPLPLSEPSQ